MNPCGDYYILHLGLPHADGLNKAWRGWRVWTWYNAQRIKTDSSIDAFVAKYSVASEMQDTVLLPEWSKDVTPPFRQQNRQGAFL